MNFKTAGFILTLLSDFNLILKEIVFSFEESVLVLKSFPKQKETELIRRTKVNKNDFIRECGIFILRLELEILKISKNDISTH